MKTCPTCGCQIMSPFPWQSNIIIHDVEECRIREEREIAKRHAKDLEADDEINRRRMGRHFESQHWGA